MKLTMLGTGNALVTEVYNTCFVLSQDDQMLLVDGGGGNTLLKQLKRANINWMDIHDVIVTHKHIDHIMGIVWMVRMFGQYMDQGEYIGEASIYGHQELMITLRKVCELLLNKKELKYIDDRIHFVSVADGETKTIIQCPVTFFDIGSTKAKQYGFTINYNSQNKLTCCGDEPYNECEYQYANNATWLLHEAFCLYDQRDIFHPYQKHHSTVKDACELASDLNVKNLVLYHSEDKNIDHRKELYYQEGKDYFQGNLFIPDDIESFEL